MLTRCEAAALLTGLQVFLQLFAFGIHLLVAYSSRLLEPEYPVVICFRRLVIQYFECFRQLVKVLLLPGCTLSAFFRYAVLISSHIYKIVKNRIVWCGPLPKKFGHPWFKSTWLYHLQFKRGLFVM